MGKEFPPSPVPNEVQFYRNVASNAPYADVSSAPPKGNPPDACGGYVMANLPNDVVSLVHIPQVPTFPNYTGATDATVNAGDDYQVSFYSIVIYGAEKQLDALGTLENSQIGNTQIAQNPDGSATVVLYPDSATQEQIDQIAAVVDANGWNLLKSGKQTDLAPNLLVIREKGQNQNWENALSANDVTQGAPCPQSTDSSLPLPQDPPDAAGHPDQRHGAHRPARRELLHRCVPGRHVPGGLPEPPAGSRPAMVRLRRLADPAVALTGPHPGVASAQVTAAVRPRAGATLGVQGEGQCVLIGGRSLRRVDTDEHRRVALGDRVPRRTIELVRRPGTSRTDS